MCLLSRLYGAEPHTKLFFPVHQMEIMAKNALANYTAELAEYAGLNAVDEGRRHLKRALDEIREGVEEKNTRLMTALCYEPLQAAKQQLRMHVSALCLSPNCNLQEAHKTSFLLFFQ